MLPPEVHELHGAVFIVRFKILLDRAKHLVGFKLGLYVAQLLDTLARLVRVVGHLHRAATGGNRSAIARYQ